MKDYESFLIKNLGTTALTVPPYNILIYILPNKRVCSNGHIVHYYLIIII